MEQPRRESSEGGEMLSSRLAALEEALQEREGRIRMLESQLALAQSEAREAKESKEALASDASAQPLVIRIGDGRRQGSERRETLEEKGAEVLEFDGSLENKHSQGVRPVLRLYGEGEDDHWVSDGEKKGEALAMMIPQQSFQPAVENSGWERLPLAPVSRLQTWQSASSQPPHSHPISPSRDEGDSNFVESYRAALRRLAERRYEDADRALADFLMNHPTHPYADNAMYWRAEIRFLQRDCEGAEHILRTLLERYPQGNKVPDALFRLATCRRQAGDMAGSQRYLQRLREEHSSWLRHRLEEGI
ncbi:MAG: tetratricopeptide repeat protein [Sandaracinaceae bacterium]|nr:tetratricopeptide repeat protein [Sandaracinaceae bacterium]